MINLKFDLTFDEEKISSAMNGKVRNLVAMFNSHLNNIQSLGMFRVFDDGDKYFVVFVPDWLDTGSHTCFAWTSENRDDVTGFLESLAKFPQIFCKVLPALPL